MSEANINGNYPCIYCLFQHSLVVYVMLFDLTGIILNFHFTHCNILAVRSDPGYLDSFIKGELMRRVSEAFPEDFANNEVARNLYRDRIIECVKLTHQVTICFIKVFFLL